MNGMQGCTMRKIVETIRFITKDTSTIMRNPGPPYIILYPGKGLRMIVLYSILESITKGTSCSTIFRMVHPYIAIE